MRGTEPSPDPSDGKDGRRSGEGGRASDSEQDAVAPCTGEVAEFETQVPHWFGSTGQEPAEILSIFGRPGEHMTVRTHGTSSVPD